MAARTNLSWAPCGAAQSEPTKLQDALQVCEPHLDLFALTPRELEALGASERPGNVSTRRRATGLFNLTTVARVQPAASVKAAGEFRGLSAKSNSRKGVRASPYPLKETTE